MAIGGNATLGTLTHGSAPGITSNLNSTPGFVTAIEPGSNTTGTSQAYLTILFFDERFNFIAAADGGVAQQQVASTWATSTPALALANIKAPKNGYVYVYVSNRSDQSVYFDNMVVGVVAGNIIEEDHYYSFGLKIAAISSKKLGDAGEGKLSNPYLYNDKEMLDEDAGLNWYDYGFRNYDPQIGRFMQLDPLTDDYPFQTPYQFAGNDPVANVDLDGLEEATSINAIGGGVVEEAFKGGEIANLAPVTVTHAFVAAKSSTTFFSVTGSFLKGVVGSVWGTIKGVGQIIAHPINTISGVVHAVAHPIQTFNAIKKVVVNTYNEFKNGDANTRANILGNLSGNIAQVFIGTGEIKVVEEVTDVGKVPTDVEELGKLDKAVEKSTDLLEDANDGAEKLVGHHSDPKFMGGDPKQDLTIMPESEHIDLHRELNNHLKKYKDKAGNHMRPQNNNNGSKIQRNFTPAQRIKAMKDFYKGPGSKFKRAANDYLKQHP